MFYDSTDLEKIIKITLLDNTQYVLNDVIDTISHEIDMDFTIHDDVKVFDWSNATVMELLIKQWVIEHLIEKLVEGKVLDGGLLIFEAKQYTRQSMKIAYNDISKQSLRSQLANTKERNLDERNKRRDTVIKIKNHMQSITDLLNKL